MSPSSAAGVIAGMLQGKVVIGDVWDRLSDDVVREITTTWASSLASNCTSVEILDTLKCYPELAAAWDQLSSPVRDQRLRLIDQIIGNVVAPDSENSD